MIPIAEETTPKLAAGMGRRLGVADLEADREAFLGGEPAGGLDQLRRQVDAADVGPRAGGEQGERSCPRRHVEPADARPRLERARGARAPAPASARRAPTAP